MNLGRLRIAAELQVISGRVGLGFHGQCIQGRAGIGRGTQGNRGPLVPLT